MVITRTQPMMDSKQSEAFVKEIETKIVDTGNYTMCIYNLEFAIGHEVHRFVFVGEDVTTPVRRVSISRYTNMPDEVFIVENCLETRNQILWMCHSRRVATTSMTDWMGV